MILHNNQLSGTISANLFALPLLRQLRLDSNKFTGLLQVPEEILKTSLRYGKIELFLDAFT